MNKQDVTKDNIVENLNDFKQEVKDLRIAILDVDSRINSIENEEILEIAKENVLDNIETYINDFENDLDEIEDDLEETMLSDINKELINNFRNYLEIYDDLIDIIENLSEIEDYNVDHKKERTIKIKSTNIKMLMKNRAMELKNNNVESKEIIKILKDEFQKEKSINSRTLKKWFKNK